MTSGSSSGWLQGDVLAEAFELVDEASDLALRVTALVVVAAEVVVDLAGREHVPVGDEDRVFDGAERAAVADPGPEALVLGLQVAAVGAGGCERCFFEGDSEPLAAFAAAAGAAFAGGLVVAGAAAGPAGEVAGGGEAAHVGADLSDHDLGGAGGDAGDRAREPDAGGERAELFLDRVGEPIDLLVEEVEVGEDRADHERVVSLETTLERLLERGQLCTH